MLKTVRNIAKETIKARVTDVNHVCTQWEVSNDKKFKLDTHVIRVDNVQIDARREGGYDYVTNWPAAW